MPERPYELLPPVVNTFGTLSPEAGERLGLRQFEAREQIAAEQAPAEAGPIIEPLAPSADVEVRPPQLGSDAARRPILARDSEIAKHAADTKTAAAEPATSTRVPSPKVGELGVREEMASIRLDEFIVPREVPTLQHGEFFARESEGPLAERRRDVASGNQPAVWRRAPVSDGSPMANEETIVQVRIGRIEVRMNTGPAVPLPAPSRARGPLGFAGYEPVRRYLTRSRS